MTELKNRNYYRETESKIKKEISAETLNELMRTVYNLGVEDGVKQSENRHTRDLEVIKETVDYIIDNEVMGITSVDDKLEVEDSLNEYVLVVENTIKELSREEKEFIDFNKAVSNDFETVVRYLKILDKVMEVRD